MVSQHNPNILDQDSKKSELIEIAQVLKQAALLYKEGNLAQAEVICKQILQVQPTYVDALHLLGMIGIQGKEFEKAIIFFTQALTINPAHVASCNNRANALQELHRYEEAVLGYDQAIALQPNYAEAYRNRGHALQALGRLDEAIKSYDAAIAMNSDVSDHNHRGNTLQALGRLEEAIASYDQAIANNPGDPVGHNNRGFVLQALGRSEEALVSYSEVIRLNPSAEAFYNLGVILQACDRFEQALMSYDQALAMNPNYVEAFNNRGAVLNNLRRFDQALMSYNQAIKINHDYAESYSNRGSILHYLKRFDESIASYEQALAIDPKIDFIFGTLLHAKMFICDWQDCAQQIDALGLRIMNGEKVCPPFPLLSMIESPEIQKKCAQIYANANFPPNPTLGVIPRGVPKQKIVIGYFSADFRNHPISFLTAQLYEYHDRDRFETIAFSFGFDDESLIRARIKNSFDRFIDVRAMTDQAVAQLARELSVDIAVDLGGYTRESRTGIFAYRAAPIQVNYLGYPGTMAAEYMDYLIADETLIPAHHQEHYSEKIVYLPNSYQANDQKRDVSDKAMTRSQLGLPDSGFVFCCFNSTYKILPATFTSWMEILKSVEGSVLWLLEDNSFAASNLRKEAEKQGVSANRLIFAERMMPAEHLARHGQADLFLDTLPYNAHTTASDALWAGLPVLTCIGESFASRVGASLLNAVDLPELIARTTSEYEALAIELASDPKKLKAIKQGLVNDRLTSSLFDSLRFTRHLELAYKQIMERYWGGLAPSKYFY